MRVGGLSITLAVLLAVSPGLAMGAAKKPAAHAAAKKATPAPAPEPPPPPPPPPNPDAQVKTSDQLKREGVKGAAMTPLRDLNVVRTKIPDVLLAALTDPYERPPKNWKCPQLIALISPLDDALGPDLDREPPGDEDLTRRTERTALGAAADLATGAIPFHGWIRKLSGAESHDKLVQSAIIAGDVRRAYLKGLGEAKGCTPPATPSHERAGSAPADDRRFKPLYPTRKPAEQQTSAGTTQGAPRR